MIKGLKHLSYEAQVDGVWSTQPGKEKAHGDLIMYLKIRWGKVKKDENGLLLPFPSDRTRGNRHKSKHKKLI